MPGDNPLPGAPALGLIVFLVSPALAQETALETARDTAIVRGSVIDQESERPISGVAVTLETPQGETVAQAITSISSPSTGAEIRTWPITSVGRSVVWAASS